MIERLLEAFFRHKILILIPVLAIPLVATAMVLATPPQYEASAGVWVERATYLTYSSDDLGRYLTPAQNQRNRLVELMQTRSFLAAVASKTSLRSLLNAPNGDDSLAQTFARDFDVAVAGDHLLVLRFRMVDRIAAGDVLSAVVEEFKARAAADRYAQGQVAIGLLQTRLTDGESALATARGQVAKYIAANPSIGTAIANGGIESAKVDPQFADLQRSVDSSQREADTARSLLASARLDVSTGVQGDQLSFRITDQVQVSATASRQLKKVLVYPILALVAGLVIGISILLLFALSDHSVRSMADLSPDIVILGVLPHLQPLGSARRAGPAATRRGIGHRAGAVLALRERIP
ncbi:MAG TPA: Wzz/FepE/Etk N-terminal domain-containing protein [Candidatus Limnocylindria bacterium]|jgi:capsular polysaccharide biosynthesis protein